MRTRTLFCTFPHYHAIEEANEVLFSKISLLMLSLGNIYFKCKKTHEIQGIQDHTLSQTRKEIQLQIAIIQSPYGKRVRQRVGVTFIYI